MYISNRHIGCNNYNTNTVHNNLFSKGRTFSFICIKVKLNLQSTITMVNCPLGQLVDLDLVHVDRPHLIYHN